MAQVRAVRVLVPASVHDEAVAWWGAALGGRVGGSGGPATTLTGARSRVGVRVVADDSGQGYEVELATGDVEADVGGLVAAGGRLVDEGPGRAVVTDPAGLSVRVVVDDGERVQLDDDRGALHLRVLMLDVPADTADEVAGFWAAALGGEPVPVGARYPEYTWIRQAAGPGGPVNLCVQALHDGGPRMHVDLHCPDEAARDAELARLTRLGAQVTARTHHWVVLRAPGGQLACVVPDQR